MFEGVGSLSVRVRTPLARCFAPLGLAFAILVAVAPQSAWSQSNPTVLTDVTIKDTPPGAVV
jgi:hypothetical protein